MLVSIIATWTCIYPHPSLPIPSSFSLLNPHCLFSSYRSLTLDFPSLFPMLSKSFRVYFPAPFISTCITYAAIYSSTPTIYTLHLLPHTPISSLPRSASLTLPSILLLKAIVIPILSAASPLPSTCIFVELLPPMCYLLHPSPLLHSSSRCTSILPPNPQKEQTLSSFFLCIDFFRVSLFLTFDSFFILIWVSFKLCFFF